MLRIQPLAGLKSQELEGQASYVDWLQAYGRAIKRAVMQKRQEAGEAHVLDLGAGSGTLSVLAARAGADSVTAVEMLEPLCRIARGVRTTGL